MYKDLPQGITVFKKKITVRNFSLKFNLNSNKCTKLNIFPAPLEWYNEVDSNKRMTVYTKDTKQVMWLQNNADKGNRMQNLVTTVFW